MRTDSIWKVEQGLIEWGVWIGVCCMCVKDWWWRFRKFLSTSLTENRAFCLNACIDCEHCWFSSGVMWDAVWYCKLEDVLVFKTVMSSPIMFSDSTAVVLRGRCVILCLPTLDHSLDHFPHSFFWFYLLFESERKREKNECHYLI